MYREQRGNFYPRDARGTAYRALARAPEPTQDLRPRNHPLIHELRAPQPHRPLLPDHPYFLSRVSNARCGPVERRGPAGNTGGRWRSEAGKGPPPSFSLGEV